jgi:hypothetical protein
LSPRGNILKTFSAQCKLELAQLSNRLDSCELRRSKEQSHDGARIEAARSYRRYRGADVAAVEAI